MDRQTGRSSHTHLKIMPSLALRERVAVSPPYRQHSVFSLKAGGYIFPLPLISASPFTTDQTKGVTF